VTDQFDCDKVGNTDECIGCKLVCNIEEGWIKFLQPVLHQSFADEFDLPQEKAPNTPARGGQILLPCDEKDGLELEEQAKHRTGVGKLLYMMQWSRPEILNLVRKLSKCMKTASEAHMKAMHRVMAHCVAHCVATPECGLLLKPARKWDGNPNFAFEITGMADSNYATNVATQRSVSGYSTFLEGAPLSMKSSGQKSATLSTAEAELALSTSCALKTCCVK
jgi:hypothetical protein